jgi:Flp pilus assembly protein TadD
MALVRLERNAEALEAFDKSIELNPDVAEVWLGKGMALVRLERNAEARKAFEKAIKIEPALAKDLNELMIKIRTRLKK